MSRAVPAALTLASLERAAALALSSCGGATRTVRGSDAIGLDQVNLASLVGGRVE
jgi:hypothetical protein